MNSSYTPPSACKEILAFLNILSLFIRFGTSQLLTQKSTIRYEDFFLFQITGPAGIKMGQPGSFFWHPNCLMLCYQMA